MVILITCAWLRHMSSQCGIQSVYHFSEAFGSEPEIPYVMGMLPQSTMTVFELINLHVFVH
jgi:hypothetical protein